VSSKDYVYEIVPSPFGDVTLLWTETQGGPRVWEILLPNEAPWPGTMSSPKRAHPDVADLTRSLGRYLEGEDIELPTDLLDRSRCSAFQWSVLMAERTIPRGFVTSYSRLAARVGSPRAYRAVGTALARNPFPLIVPCHRTVRGDGSLGGFGGGLPLKTSLLEMEGVGFDARGRVRPEFFWDWQKKA